MKRQRFGRADAKGPVCREAPRILTLSGVGDLVAKFTAVRDWKLAFRRTGEPLNDFAALLSDGSIHSYLSHPRFDLKGIRLLATSLLLNGIAMEICGSSRPASGSEHLISHALDALSARPRLHGLQVGIAAYLVSILQGGNTDRIAGLFDVTGFWDGRRIRANRGLGQGVRGRRGQSLRGAGTLRSDRPHPQATDRPSIMVDGMVRPPGIPVERGCGVYSPPARSPEGRILTHRGERGSGRSPSPSRPCPTLDVAAR